MLASDLRFDPVAHSYHAGHRRVPGVTSVLQQIDELDGIPREFLEAAARFGTHVHLATHLFDTGQLDEPSLDRALVPYLDGWRRFLHDSRARVIESERRVYHERLGFAGTLDKVVEWHDLPDVIDIKSGAAVLRSVRPQTAAYREARMSEGDIKLSKSRYCVHLTKDGKYKVHRYRDPSDFNIFLSCLNIHRWMNT